MNKEKKNKEEFIKTCFDKDARNKELMEQLFPYLIKGINEFLENKKNEGVYVKINKAVFGKNNKTQFNTRLKENRGFLVFEILDLLKERKKMESKLKKEGFLTYNKSKEFEY